MSDDVRPVPDPTTLTTEQLARGLLAEREWALGQIRVLEERLAGMDKATDLRIGSVEAIPALVDNRVGHLRDLMDERFIAIGTQFKERDTRQDRESRDNKVAVDAAFAAQKEAAAKQDESNTKAIDKSEAATAETLRTLAELFKTSTDAIVVTITDLKSRMDRIEGVKLGGSEQRIDSRAVIATVVGLVVVALAIVALIVRK